MTTWSEFCPAGYANIINGLRNLGYAPHSFHSVDPNARHVVIRHDVDFSLDAAVLMAEQERQLGVNSAYFILVRTEFYNALSAAGSNALRRILDLGHEIGLHFDASLYAGRDIVEEIQRESEWLASALGTAVGSVSFHRPANEIVGGPNKLAGLTNTYGQKFVEDMAYCSDSRGVWRFGHPFDNAAIQEGRALQLLVHPFWWTEPAMSPEDRLRSFLARRTRDLDEELARHCVVHIPQGS
jgi:hypothetical protein